MALDEQDKKWLVEQFQEQLQAFEQRLEATLDVKLEQTLEAKLAGLEGRFDTKLQETETKLLTAFFGYQEHWEIRFRKLFADVSNVNGASEQRVNNLEQRVIAIEKRLLMGPPPPPAPPGQ